MTIKKIIISGICGLLVFFSGGFQGFLVRAQSPTNNLVNSASAERYQRPNTLLSKPALKFTGIDIDNLNQLQEDKGGTDVDSRISTALQQLVTPGEKGGKHELISASIIKGYVSKRRSLSRETYIPPSDTAEVSEHFRGQAADIYQIDYLKCTRITENSKTKLPPKPIEVEWQTNQVANTGAAEGVAFNSPSFASLAGGITAGSTGDLILGSGCINPNASCPNYSLKDLSQLAGLKQIAENINLDWQTLANSTPENWSSNLAFAGLAQAFGVRNPQAIAGSNSLDDLGLAIVADQSEQALQLPPGVLFSKTTEEIFTKLGQAAATELFRLPPGANLKDEAIRKQIAAQIEGAGNNLSRIYNAPADMVKSLNSDNPDYLGLGTYSLGHRLLLDNTQIEELLGKIRSKQAFDPDLSRITLDNDMVDSGTIKKLLNADQKGVWTELIGDSNSNKIFLQRQLDENYWRLPEYVRTGASEALGTSTASPSLGDFARIIANKNLKNKYVAIASGEAVASAIDMPENTVSEIVSGASAESKAKTLFAALEKNIEFAQTNNLDYDLNGYGSTGEIQLNAKDLSALVSSQKQPGDWAQALKKMGIGTIADNTELPADLLGGLVLQDKIDPKTLGTFAAELTGRYGQQYSDSSSYVDLLAKAEAAGADFNTFRNMNLSDLLGLDNNDFKLEGGKLVSLWEGKDEAGLQQYFDSAVKQVISSNLQIPLELTGSYIFPRPGDAGTQNEIFKQTADWLSKRIGLKYPDIIMDAYLGSGAVSGAYLSRLAEVTKIPLDYSGDISALLNGDLPNGFRALSAAALVQQFGKDVGFGYDIARLSTLGIAGSDPDKIKDYVTGKLKGLPGMDQETIDSIIVPELGNPKSFLDKWISGNILDTLAAKKGSLSPLAFTASYLNSDALKAAAVAAYGKNIIASNQVPAGLDFDSWFNESIQTSLGNSVGDYLDENFGKNVLDVINNKLNLGSFMEGLPTDGNLISSVLNNSFKIDNLNIETLGKIFSGGGAFDDFQNAGLILNSNSLASFGQSMNLGMGGWGTLAAGLISGKLDMNSIVTTAAAIYGGPIASMALGVIGGAFGIEGSSKILCAADYYPEIDQAVEGNPAPIDATTPDGRSQAEFVNARFKIQQVLGQLVDLKNKLADQNLMPTQIWTLQKEDVMSDWEKITAPEQYGDPDSWGRRGVWPNQLADGHIHFGY